MRGFLTLCQSNAAQMQDQRWGRSSGSTMRRWGSSGAEGMRAGTESGCLVYSLYVDPRSDWTQNIIPPTDCSIRSHLHNESYVMFTDKAIIRLSIFSLLVWLRIASCRVFFMMFSLQSHTVNSCCGMKSALLSDMQSEAVFPLVCLWNHQWLNAALNCSCPDPTPEDKPTLFMFSAQFGSKFWIWFCWCAGLKVQSSQRRAADEAMEGDVRLFCQKLERRL